MFIGHYSVALAARALPNSPPLWSLCLAVQAVDVLWAGFVMTGIEAMRISPGHMEASALDLYHMPWTHSLLGALAWSGLFGGVWWMMARGRAGGRLAVQAAAIVAAAVFSHWLLDLWVHGPDLQIVPWDETRVGLGLWNDFWATQAVEAGLVVVAAAVMAKARGADWRLWAFVGALLVLQAMQHILPLPEGSGAFAAQGLAAYCGVTLAGWLVERPVRGWRRAS